MIKFSFLAAHLQLRIIEKINYFDKTELEQSSKHGTTVVKSVNYKIMLPVYTISLGGISTELVLSVETPNKSYKTITWSQLREMPEIPPLKVSEVWIDDEYLLNGELSESLECLAEFGKKSTICSSKVKLWLDWFSHGNPVPSQLFEQLTEIFNITTFHATWCEIDEGIYFLPSFQKIIDLHITITDISEAIVEQIKAKEIFFYIREPKLAAITANLFFQEWLVKRRTIESFVVSTDGGLVLENIFTGIPFSLIRKYEEKEESKSKMKIKKNIDLEELEQICKTADIYSIDRGDKKLLVFLDRRNQIGAVECINITEIIEDDDL